MEELMLSVEGTTAPVAEAPAETEAKAGPAKSRGKRNGRAPIPEHLKRNIIDLDVPESEKVCPVSGKQRPLIGYEESEKYHYVKESLEVNVYRRAKYGSPMGAEENGVLVADLPECMIPRCMADASMLAHVAVSGQGPPLVHFAFSPNRKQQHVLSFFRGYGGAVMCDEYAGYENMDCGVKQSCWAHVRRKFNDAKLSEPAYSEEVLQAIGKLYAIEKRIADMEPEDRARIRNEQSCEAAEAVFTLLENRSSLPASSIGKAVRYALGHKKGLMAYLEDERLPIDNKPAERAVRRVAIGRKNWLFLGSETGGETAATLMTLLGSCWANRVNALDYLTDVIAKLPGTSADDLDTLLPDLWIKDRPEAVLPDQNWRPPRDNARA